ncbi:uricase [Actinorhabdospora filicis]|uniref:Uricase n=1 Tax=Actinorhabdospora filicis TaxID=1785913 RepID=A0A9W6SKM2_9ACTN|nr:urate oxidase [Actinorhabdospora filicis]GLZ77552.1 uricase [Actinorhabdospora filicis]
MTDSLLQHHQYGKRAIRLVHVTRDGDRHELTDLDVDVTLTGEFEETYLTGANAGVLPTDSQKNTVYAFARQHGVQRIEDFALLLARHFVRAHETVKRARIGISRHHWDRITPQHSFVRSEGELRTVTVTHDAGKTWVVGGLTGLRLLNSTGSEFKDFPRDEYTTLPEAGDRILATSVSAGWRYEGTRGDWDAWHGKIRAALVTAFTETYSRSLQQTLYAMGEKALAACPAIAEIRLALPNQHHIAVDLSPFGLDNPNSVFVATEQPYGLIEGALMREGAVGADAAWW